MGAIGVVILAAGKGTRMKSVKAKVLHEICGVPMVDYPIRLARALEPAKIAVVVGFQGEAVREALSGHETREETPGGLTWVEQAEQLGTGHAVACAREPFADFTGDLVILYGDVPLLRLDTVERLLEVHRTRSAAVTVLTVNLEDPSGYGRMVRDDAGEIARIVEHKDAGPETLAIREINTGIYCFDGAFLFRALEGLGDSNAQGEYYLTDLVETAREEGRTVAGLLAPDPKEVSGINNRRELAQAAAAVQRGILERHMLDGVTLVDPSATYIEAGVTIGRDTVIEPGCMIRGATTIGEACTVEQGCRISGAQIENSACIRAGTVVDGACVVRGATVGPLAHLTGENPPEP